MPELPEVETVRRGLLPVLDGQRIETADIRRPDLRWPLPNRMSERLNGATVTSLTRRSKYILAALDTGETLIVHLGMSGRILISGDVQGRFVHTHPPLQKHDHVILDMQNGARITYNDARRFGAMDLIDTAQADQHPWLATLGPEPLGNAFSETYLQHALTRRKTPIKSALLDQRIVAGLGNIYVCEVLHRAGIAPTRKANAISGRRVATLVPIVRDVLEEAIKAGGSSLKDFRQTDGELGYFQHSFAAYGKEHAPCPTPDCGGHITRITQAGRSTFYCPQCQR